jgi:hypothetical protein
VGREFFYCSNCQTRLSGDDFDLGLAVKVGDLVACERCVGALIAPLSLKEQEAILLQIRTAREMAGMRPRGSPPAEAPHPPLVKRGSTSTRVRAVRAPGAPPAGKAPASASGGHAGTIFFIGALALLGALAALYFLVGSHELTEARNPSRDDKPDAAAAPAPPVKFRPAPAPAAKPPPPAASPRYEAAQAALARAREAGANLGAQVELYKKAVFESTGTPYLEEAQKELEAVQKKLQEAVAADLGPLDQQIRAACTREEFRRALDLLESARTRYPSGEWTQAVDLRIRDVTVKDAWTAFLPLRDRALDAKRRNASEEVQAIRDRVSKWGLPSFAAELEKALSASASEAAAPPPPTPPDLKPLTEEAKVYQKFWQEAFTMAGGREHDAALAALERAVERVKDPELRAEAQADVEALRLAAGAYRAALQAIAAWPKGERIPLEVLDELASPEKMHEPFLRADGRVIEVMRGGEPFPIETSEVTARSLGAIFKGRAEKKPDTDGRAAALLCLAEGDVEGARALLAGPSDALPWKYWSLAAKIAEGRPNPATEAGRREIAARKLYFAAERERRATRTRGAAIEKVRSLLNEFADTSIAKAKRAHLAAQRDAGKEYVFLASDLDASGSFRASRHAKAGACWTSESETDPVRGKDNAIDFQFYALPDAPYKCWVYVGACCAETFTFYYQATDLTVAHPQTREMLRADPGGNVSVPVKHSITFLKPRHDQHGGPKEPKRWEWVAVPLPKYTAAGLKGVRLLSEEKGFSVAIAVVSNVRPGPPLESELKAWIRSPSEPEEEPGAAAEAKRDPALAAHWKLDETGGTALDASGNDNTAILVNEPARAPGRIAGGLALDGKDRYLNVPASPALAKLNEASYTIALWVRPHSRPPGAEASANDGSYALVMRTGQHEGLKYGSDQKFALDHWLADGTGVGVTSAGTYPPGSWYHVAGVVNRADGTLRLYVNGKPDGAVPFPAGTAARDFGSETWKVGIAAPGAPTHRWAADATLDDVRLYSRALTMNDVRILAGGSAAGPISIALTSPSAAEKFESQAMITMSASVANGEGRVTKVEFFQGSLLLGADTSAPYVFAWNKVPSGMYTLTARATDRAGAVYVSEPLTIRVGNASLYRAIDLAGSAFKADGMDWEGKDARNVRTFGQALERREADLDPPAPDPARASMIRTSVFSREGTVVSLTPVPNGSYQVYLYVWSPGDSQTYDVLLKGKVVVPKYVSGPAGRWERLGPWFLDVTDGAIELSAKGGEAHFSGLEIWRVTR